ncbi:MAG: queuosine precursor transporter [Paludibacteraceae bacterium]|nr:queuosine precursor transporter [Paludibacteraceae bacterium]
MNTRLFNTKQSWLLLLTGAYCVISVMMNYLCMKPMSFGTDWIWMDGGLLISWLTFLISNILVEAYDKHTAILITGIATVLTLAVSVLGVAEVYLPTLPQYTGQAEHFAYIFSNGPRTIVASALAFFAGNVCNVSVIARLKKNDTSTRQSLLFPFWIRAVVATVIGQIVDNTLFQVLAFAPIGLSIYEMFWHDIWTAIGVSVLFESVVEAFFVPLIALPLTRHIISLK